VRLYYGSKIEWGTTFFRVSENKTVGQMAWRDNNVVLFATTIDGLGQTIERMRKRPGKTRTGAVQTRKVFGDDIKKMLPIPTLIDSYNHYMNSIDRFDQLKSYYTTLRVHRKTWRSLFHLIIDIILVNCFKLSDYSNAKKLKRSGHRRFLQKLVAQLLEASSKQVWLRRQNSVAGIKRIAPEEHQNVVIWSPPLSAKTCIHCAAAGRRSSPKKRPRLAELPTSKLNSQPASSKAAAKVDRRRTRWGCFQCQLPVCEASKRPCWGEHLREVGLQCKLLSETKQETKQEDA
jgi:hypothetical protein